MFNNIKVSKENINRSIFRIALSGIFSIILLILAIIWRENYCSDAVLFGCYIMAAIMVLNIAILVSIVRRRRMAKKYGVGE